MNRHENIVCKGCGKVDFTGRCYRCLSCQDFNMCAECYDIDFTTAQHPFDHPVKCVLTPADVEIYFGGEYLNDPPQSYRCPYCKQWGYNESTFLEHVSAEHVGASTLLVSTMVTLFEQQQAVRLFLEDEQLAVFASTATSRNELMNRNDGSLELYLEPLNPNGSYQRDHQVPPLNFRVSKPGAVEVAPWVAESVALSASNSNRNVDDFPLLDPVRRQVLMEEARQRFAMITPQQRQQQQQQQQQQLSSAQPTLSEMMRFSEPLPTSRQSRLSNFRALANQSPNQTSSGRSINLFGNNVTVESVRRTFYPPGEISRTRAPRHRNPRLQMEGFPASGVRQVHVQRLRGGPGAAGQPGGQGLNQRLVEFSDLGHGATELLNNLGSGSVLLRTIEEEELQPQSPVAADSKHLELERDRDRDRERERYLCYPFLSSASGSQGPPDERISFLVKRAEFVAQLLASVLCEEELGTPISNESGNPTQKLRQRSTSEFVGAGDSELDLKHTKPC